MRNIVEEIETTINKIRPFLQRDGGDIEFIKFEDGIVTVKILGACSGCSLQEEHIDKGIEDLLIEEIPGVIGLKAI